ncbi:hypothetical protein [Bacillus phage vB_BanS-Thrax3]|nr:hypothetical protein [Bacillus phage vB_BanS-Thrax3]
MAIVASGQLTLVDLNDSKQLLAYIGSTQQRQVIFNPNGNTYYPDYSTANNVLTPQLFIAGTPTDVGADVISTKWFVQTNSTGVLTEITASTADYALGTGKPVTLTIKNNVLSSNNSMTYVCEMQYPDKDTGFTVTAKAEYEIVKVTNGTDGKSGANAIMGILSNDSHTLPADSNGNVSSFAGATSTLTIYEGATATTTGWTVTQARSAGLTVAEATTAWTATITGMTTDTGYVEFTAKKTGYSDVVKRFTITKNKSGANATAYWLLSSNVAIAKNSSGNYVPATLTITGKSQSGTSAVVDYKGRFSIYESTDGTTFPNKKYESTADEATGSYTYTPSAGIKSARIRLYQAGGLTVMLDEQIIPVVMDGTNGKDSISGVVWTPDGNAMKNSSATLKAQMDIYQGSTLVPVANVTAYKWYYQEPSATIANGQGDADGGDGWKLMKDTATANGCTGYNTYQLTIPASAVLNVESFKCVATYQTVKYKDVCTILDVSDPFLISIVGVNTFKNGQGTTTLTAKIYQAGAEVDALNNQGYTYTWYLYNAQNVKVTGWSKTGKTITVSSDDVDIRANVVCEVSK